MEYNTFLFDLDGTLIDSSEGIINSVIYALKKFGIEETEREKMHAFIGPPLTDSFTKYYGFSEEESWKAVVAYREYYQDKGIFECKLYDGIPDVLKAVKQAGKKLWWQLPNRKYMQNGLWIISHLRRISHALPEWNWMVAEGRRRK